MQDTWMATAVPSDLEQVRGALISLIKSRRERAPETPDRYADLRSWWRTPEAEQLIHRIYADIEEHEQKTSSRARRRQARYGKSFTDALIRFVGDLLRAGAGTNTTGRIYRSTGEEGFRSGSLLLRCTVATCYT